MPTYHSIVNGSHVHYYVNSSEPCHPAIIAGNYIDDSNGLGVSADIIQLDAISLGVIVPLRRNGMNYDETITTNGTIHATCSRTN
jgi:hypothetical protein